MESPHWSRFFGRTCDLMGDSCWSSLFLKDFTPWKGPILEFTRNCSLWEAPTLVKFMKDCLLCEGSHTEADEEKGDAEMMHYELTATPIPHPSVLLGGRS